MASIMFWLLVQAVNFFWMSRHYSHKQRFPGWIKDVRRWIYKVPTFFEKKTFFENYPNLPPELRMMIIDEMKHEDRCRFTRCSKLCSKEAKASNNYIYSLQLFVYHQNLTGIRIGHTQNGFDLFLNFENENGKKWIKCDVLSRDKVLRIEELDSSTDLVEHAAEYFKKLLQEHQKRLKHLKFSGDEFANDLKDYDFGIDNLNNLKELEINGSMDVALYLSKTRRPLDKLIIGGYMNDRILTESKQIYTVRNCLTMPDTKFTHEEFLQLSAQNANIHIGYLTELDIYNFIRSWQNGTIGKEVGCYEWVISNSPNFNVAELFRLFGVVLHDHAHSISIKHNKGSQNDAKLSYINRWFFKFEVIENN